MPSNQELQDHAEDFKTKGNQAFQKSELDTAVKAYSQGLVQVDRMTTAPTKLKAALLSNRAACYLKQAKLQECQEDCTLSLAILDGQGGNGNSNDASRALRSKLLYRRAKALFLKANMPHRKEEDDLNLAAKDLLNLLSFDASNKEATKLLHTIRAQHATEKKNDGSNTPMAKTLREIEKKDDKFLQNLKVLMGLLTSDPISACMDFGRRGGVGLLLGIINTPQNEANDDKDSEAINNNDNDNFHKIRRLSLQCLSCAGSYPLFCRTFLNDPAIQTLLSDLIVKACDPDNVEDQIATGAFTICIRLILHLDRDDPKEEIGGKTHLLYTPLIKSIISAFQSNHPGIIRAAVDVMSSWTAGKNREMAIRASLTDGMSSDLPVPLTKYEQHSLKPKDLSDYKQRLYKIRTRDEAWAFERSTLFCQQGGLPALLGFSVGCEDSNLRREITAVLAKALGSLADDDKMQEVAKPILGSVGTKKGSNEEEKEEPYMGPTIEEIDDDEEVEVGIVQDVDEDEDENNVIEEVSMEVLKQRAELATALLMVNSSIGGWSMGTGWPGFDDHLNRMAESNDINALRIVAELLSSAASVKETRPMVGVYLNNDSIKALVTHEDRNVRTAATSAVAKLGLAEEETRDFEVIGLLEAACYMLEDGEESIEASNAAEGKNKANALANIPMISGAKSSVERGVEVIAYLVTKTIVKEEVAHGFKATTASKYNALELLIKVSENAGAGESVAAFGLASIFQFLAVTPLTLKKEAFEGKEVTMEQYDEIQRMQKIQEQKETETDEQDLIDDNEDQCAQRVVKMANAGVPRALIQLAEGSSDQSLEQIVVALKRIANVQSVRGTMIQQGVLSALIKLEKNEKNPSDVRKKIVRNIRHCMAKLLVTINPGLLTSAQSMGSIKPLIQLVREIESNDLQKFEALMSLTNLVSMSDSTKNKLASEKGIHSVKYAMFSDHPMVKKAAAECLCNMVGNEQFMKTLRNTEELRLWLALASDYEEDYECARAAAGCLAMATGDPAVAKALIQIKNFKERMDTCLGSGSLEILHRTLVVVLNLVQHGEEMKDAALENGLIAFCDAYIESYHDGNKIKELGLEDNQIPAFNTTVEVAKQVIRAMDE
mmetsp:Transcript_7515/g.16193  ORF Transcript_7515/g.16193 Transcript_7515/m.16193 type:complete len:1116 (-) Transcript_7515:77-3424(-)|eukprot:CAMPEP_0168208592 /NCGR_PEP_ID=MMETSP0140_2-20121125/2151_1 /TAXON_ID=44445 /ORGANISM="Pseudo-nitzschia australis, Strain 10249 10 AB" /LENGTH=1115 /DNA_ID=CAMNT_0008135001 /DNA_START=72 /DNA_END=3419 /DNA_ORIENTATION=-